MKTMPNPTRRQRERVSRRKPSLSWQPDRDDKHSIDDLFAEGCSVHLERMDNGFYWMGIYCADGREIHIDIVNKRNKRGRKTARLQAVVIGEVKSNG